MSPVVIGGFGADWLFQRQLDSAISACRRALELNPSYPWALRWLGEPYPDRRHPLGKLSVNQRGPRARGVCFKRLSAQNVRSARRFWGELAPITLKKLRALTADLGLSVILGDLQFLYGSWYVTHAGLLRLARQGGCSGIYVRPVREFCDPPGRHWMFRATVYKSRCSKGFIGYGDADPFNVSPLVRGAEMRIVETRAVNRALRKAYGIGLCSVEELGYLSSWQSANHCRDRIFNEQVMKEIENTLSGKSSDNEPEILLEPHHRNH